MQLRYYFLLFCMFLSGAIVVAQTEEEYEEPDWNRTEWKGAFDYSYDSKVEKIEDEGESELVLNGSLIRFYFNGECFEMLK